MKKLLLLISIVFCFQFQSKASHMIGGEIWWECLSNGKYVFYAKYYRDCTGIPLSFGTNQRLDIIGNPLPRNASNGIVSFIDLIPDSAYWRNNNYGDISPSCNNGLNTGLLSCQGRDWGAYQELRFKSNPITLKGVPPVNGWRFVSDLPCCRPNIANLAASGSMLLQAIMYANKDRDPIDVCYNNSPIFAETIDYYTCRQELKIADHHAIDVENDSIVYFLDRTYNVPGINPQAVPYTFGYSFDNPTPDQNIDSLNIPANLNSQNGTLTYKINSGFGALDYWVVIRADEYRGGVKIASVFREYPIFTLDCGGSIRNPKPNIFFQVANEFNQYVPLNSPSNLIQIEAGEKLRIRFQSYNLLASSSQYSRSSNDSSLCNKPPCAELRGAIYDSIQAAYQLVNSTQPRQFYVDWQTNCNHVDSNGYIFYFENAIQGCDSLKMIQEEVRVRVIDKSSSAPQNICAFYDTTLKTDVIQWDTTGTKSADFRKWYIYRSTTPSTYSKVDSSGQYLMSGVNKFIIPSNSNTFDAKYFITSKNQGCFGENESLSSDTTMTLDTEVEIDSTSRFLYVKNYSSNYIYEWIDCSDPRQTVLGTDSSFTAGSRGFYKLRVRSLSCSSESPCIDLSGVGIQKIAFMIKLTYSLTQAMVCLISKVNWVKS